MASQRIDNVGRTETVSVHRLRRSARRREHTIQKILDSYGSDPRPAIYTEDGLLVPAWAHGVRVEKAGVLQFSLVATEHRGH